MTDNKETLSLDNQSENMPLGVHKQLDLINRQSVQFPETLMSGEALESGDADKDLEASIEPEINKPTGTNSKKSS